MHAEALRWVLIALLAVLPVTETRAEGSDAEVSQLQIERADQGLYLSAVLAFQLGPAVQEAMQRGVVVYFTAEATIFRDRWYWADKKIGTSARHFRLAFQPLTRRWRLSVGSSIAELSGPGALAQSFDSLDEALVAMRRVSRWRIAASDDIEPDARHTVEFRFRLDTSQLPRPLQLGIVGQGDWSLQLVRSVRIPVAAR